MSLSPCRRLGPYEITASLGVGGMGEVYRATDSRLGRDVAVKVLPGEVASDAERLARFRREAQLLAALNHPNVAAIYGLEEADGQPFLVLELVPGEDLAERLKRGPLPLDEAREVAEQVAEALEDAHEHGIVHRDLKPANIKVTPEGRVKVLDFGLAKAWAGDTGSVPAGDLSQSPTLVHSGTAAGVILGTVAYMSPEQARGRAVDKRADIWAFGAVLFEMLTGRRLFEGETVSDTLASVLKTDPEWTARGATPRGDRGRRGAARLVPRRHADRLHVGARPRRPPEDGRRPRRAFRVRAGAGRRRLHRAGSRGSARQARRPRRLSRLVSGREVDRLPERPWRPLEHLDGARAGRRLPAGHARRRNRLPARVVSRRKVDRLRLLHRAGRGAERRQRAAAKADRARAGRALARLVPGWRVALLRRSPRAGRAPDEPLAGRVPTGERRGARREDHPRESADVHPALAPSSWRRTRPGRSGWYRRPAARHAGSARAPRSSRTRSGPPGTTTGSCSW